MGYVSLQEGISKGNMLHPISLSAAFRSIDRDQTFPKRRPHGWPFGRNRPPNVEPFQLPLGWIDQLATFFRVRLLGLELKWNHDEPDKNHLKSLKLTSPHCKSKQHWLLLTILDHLMDVRCFCSPWARRETHQAVTNSCPDLKSSPSPYTPAQRFCSKVFFVKKKTITSCSSLC